MNKKIAILLCGQVRMINTSLLNFLNKINNIEYHIYIHYWQPEGDTYINCGNIPSNHNVENIPNNLHDILVSIYKPIKIQSEKQIYFPIPPNLLEVKTNRLNSTISQFYGIKKAYELIDNPNDYDYIIKSRFDLDIDKNMSINLFINNIFFPHNDYIWIVPIKDYHIFNIYNFVYEIQQKIKNIPEYIIENYMKNNHIFNYIKGINLSRSTNFIII